MNKQIRFMQHYVTDGETKARVFYSNTRLVDGTHPITLYARDYDRCLGKIFPEIYINDTDMMTDYFDQGHVRIQPDHPLYAAALARCQQNQAKRDAKYATKVAA